MGVLQYITAIARNNKVADTTCPKNEYIAPNEKEHGDLARFLTSIAGIGPRKADEIMRCGYSTMSELKEARFEDLCEIPGISVKMAKNITEAVKD